MFGKNIFPTTRWDTALNASHMRPNYQPLEYLIAGGYISEIVRLIMVEAADTAGLYWGQLPQSLRTIYSLDTRTLAMIELDTTPFLMASRSMLREKHASRNAPSYSDAEFIRAVTRRVTSRSIAYFTAGVHALSSLLEELDVEAGLPNPLDHISIGCDGSIINKYPGYMARAQAGLDELRKQEGSRRKKIILEETQNSAVLGAGVAAAMAGMSSHIA